jgi:glycosyltransferase involved in cell wall biosynthesis
VLGPEVAEPFPDIDYHPVAAGRDGRSYDLAQLSQAVRTIGCDVVVVQQHLRTAVAVARILADRPVILHRHSFEKENQGRIKGYIVGRRYASLAGTLAVSEALRADLAGRWPDVADRFRTVHNGLDFAEWRPAEIRRREILFVGRALKEKGLVETARGVARALAELPDWKARFILSNIHEQPSVYGRALAILQGLGDCVSVDVDLPFERVKEANEQAEIALCPSVWQEPFGRTALEAHAGGAALVSSGRGGLREVSGGHAEYLDDVTPEAIEQAVLRLAGSWPRRRALQTEGHWHARRTFDMKVLGPRYDATVAALARAWTQKGTTLSLVLA